MAAMPYHAHPTLRIRFTVYFDPKNTLNRKNFNSVEACCNIVTILYAEKYQTNSVLVLKNVYFIVMDAYKREKIWKVLIL